MGLQTVANLWKSTQYIKQKVWVNLCKFHALQRSTTRPASLSLG